MRLVRLKITSLFLFLISGCASTRPFVIPVNHPASIENENSSPWAGPKVFQMELSSEQLSDDAEMQLSASHHRHMHGGN